MRAPPETLQTPQVRRGLPCISPYLAEQSRSAQAAARALTIDLKRIYQWKRATQTPVAASLAALDLAKAHRPRKVVPRVRRFLPSINNHNGCVVLQGHVLLMTRTITFHRIAPNSDR